MNQQFNNMKSIHPFIDGVLHMNARSLPLHIDEITSVANECKSKWSVLAFTETWLNNENGNIHNFVGYFPIHSFRSIGRGGGASLYIKEDLDFVSRDDLRFDIPGECENSWVEIKKYRNGKNTIIGSIYRSPSCNIEKFLYFFEQTFAIILEENKSCVIVGDFNIDILKDRENSREYQELIMSYGFQHILKCSN